MWTSYHDLGVETAIVILMADFCEEEEVGG